MEINKKEVKQFNKKLLIVFFTILAIFATLLVAKVQAMEVSAEIQSLKQTDRPNPTYLTYSDLIDYYDILCCQHHTPLPGQGSVMLTGSHSAGSFSYDMGRWQDTGYDVGSKLEEHTIYYQGNDFDSSSYSHRTYGYYSIVEEHIATPKEAYIIAEMKKELDIAENGDTAVELRTDDGTGEYMEYEGSLENAISQMTSTGEMVYTVEQRYVLDTGSGAYYVKYATDSDGNEYYVYETGSDGSLVSYTGDFRYTDPKTGVEVDCVGVHAENIYYEFNGTITPGDSVAASEGTLYLVEYKQVVDLNGTFYYCYTISDHNYIQIAWWTTDMGTSHGTVLPSAPNSLSKEAEAFEDYILTITGKSSVSELTYETQSYDFVEEDGTHSSGAVKAPVIDYKPDFNEDADQNGVINESDEATPSFNPITQTYLVGPYSLNYVKESANIEGRKKVDFSVISDAHLITNLGELERGTDWDFFWLADQARDEDEDYEFPNPNEVFYIELKHLDDLVEIYEFGFDFKYMNAGAELDIYDGNYNQVTWTVKNKDYTKNCSDPDCDSCPHFYKRDIWIECTSVVPHDSQTLAHALIGARWYEEEQCSAKFGIKKARILIEKRTYNDEGTEIIPVNKTYQFTIKVDGKPFQDISVDVKNGYGKSSSAEIVWSKDDPAPSYEVVELGDGENNGPWTGTLEEDKLITVDAKNYLEPNKGKLKIDKRLLNPTPALEGETFYFTAEITGIFSYNNGPVQKYTSSHPLKIGNGVNPETGEPRVEIHGDGEWLSEDFKWYGAAPKYKVVENIPEGATYELVNGVISNGIGYLKYTGDGIKTATATNTPTTDWTVIKVDKRLVSETAPQPGEEFTFDLNLIGTFSYDDGPMTTYTEDNPFKLCQNEILNTGNNWSWESKKISWLGDDIPTYTVKEVTMAVGTTFVSISDETQTSLVNDFKGKLNPEQTRVIITNDREKSLIGKIKVIKLVETEDLYGKQFDFTVKVTGTFKYNGVQYVDNTLEIPVSVTGKDPADTSSKANEWESPYNFIWEKGAPAPTYEVTEVNLPTGSKFVSISNGSTTITSSKTITGTLNGVEGSTIDPDAKAGQVVITCTNTGAAQKNAHIVILKESIDERIDDLAFYFKVTVTGTFKYWDKVNPDGSIGYTQYTNDTLELVGERDGVVAYCGGEDWISELITWDETEANPTYTVEEISIPANVEFVSISNRTKTSTSTKIDGVLSEGTDLNYVTAINKPGPDFVDGSLRIIKKASRDLSGKIFYFDLEVKGEFDYAGKHYGPDTENGDTYLLENIEVVANGSPWISGVFTWDEDGTAPTYKVTEKDPSPDAVFTSISNSTEICTDPAVRSISGNLDLVKPIKITAINYSNDLPNGSHIEITKEVLNENLKGVNFYFNVKVQSTSPFRYHDLEDATKVTEYNPGDVLEFKNVIVVADERDWVSGYIEWDDGAAVPTYEISEITSAFRDGVKTVSIRNDTEIINKELNNTSGEDLTITGSLVGDVTHIIAVNDADEETPVQGKIVIEKKALNELISGEEFTFTLKITGKFTYGSDTTVRRSLEIKDIKVTADGDAWESEVIEWYERDGAPIYTVKEVTDDLEENGIKFVSIRNAYQTNTQPAITGTVEPHNNNWILAENTFAGYNKGRLQIHKILLDENGNQIDGVEFTFLVTITYADGTTQSEEITVASGGYWRSGWYNWSKRESAPKYHVEEIDNGGYECTIDNPDGELKAQNSESTPPEPGIVYVTATNVYKEEHQAQIRVNKELIVNDKLSEDDVTVDFTVLVKVTGTFTYKGNAYNNETLTLKVILSKDSSWTWLSDVIRWNGDEAPVFTVEEPEANIPVGWHLVKTEITPEDHRLVDGGTAVAEVTNEWRYNEELILTMKLGGKVWDDTNRTEDKHADALENGVIDDGEPGIENVKVTIYRALVNKSDGKVVQRLDGVFAYDPNNLLVRIDPVTYTDVNGNWNFGAVSVPAFTEAEKEQYGEQYCVTYDVEFEYDGQTYEPTEFLASSDGETKSYVGATASNNMYSDVQNKWSTIINSSTSERDKFLNDSMAIDDLNERTAFNNAFAEIQGKEVMDDEGNTVGTTGSGKELNYTSVDSISFFNSDNSRKISTLRTINDDDEIYEDLRINAATSNSELTFPFYTTDPNYDVTAWHLRGWDKTITDILKITYKFEAVYNYCLSINLGLVEREATDLALEKDLTEALVVVNGKALKYKFNTAIDLEDPDYTELLYKQLAVADAQIEYKLGLYKGDYYYRAAVYDGSDAGNALEGYYNTKLGLPLDTSEMEIYLKYTINVYNQSQTFDVTVGEVADYYDETFKLIEATESRYVQTVNGKEVDSVIEVAGPSTVKYLASSGNTELSNGSVAWTKVKDCTGSEGKKYTKMTTSSLAGTKLKTGEKASIQVTFKIDKDAVGDSGVLNTIKLGKKHNVAEVTKFTSYYSDKSENRWSTPGQISGRVDEDSAPDNVNIEYYNEKLYYEDDTDSAPIITIGINSDSRAVSGLVWDDAQTQDAGYGQTVGNGLYNPDEGDKLINEATTEIYESITIPETTDSGETVYKEYQFAWPTEEPIAALGNHKISELTGFHQTIETDNGGYSFINIPAGNYKVRYVYGDKQILTGNSGYEEVYNGQDYKSTAYQIGFNNDKDNDGYVDNEWHDISNAELSDLRVNDARDDEARRIYISAKSEMLTFDNTSLLSTADDKDADHTELFGDYQSAKNNPVTGSGYYMYAETAKINLGVENIYKIGYTTETINDVEVGIINGKSTQNGRDVGTEDFTYNIKNVDCGIEERSQTKITLDKQIKEITLMTSDNKVILDAIYDISYTMKADGSIAATVTLNKEASTASDHIASLNRRGKYEQGYRYIIAEGTILQGAQIQVQYQLSIFNMSETDRISKDLETFWAEYNATEDSNKEAKLSEPLNKVSSNLYTESKGRVFKDGSEYVPVGYGTYFGSVYYLGSQGVGVRPDETIVKTEVHQMIDYIDPDIEFTDMANSTRDQSWTNTDVEYLLNNHLIDPNIVQILDSQGRVTGDTAATRTLSTGERYTIISDKLQEYKTETKNNLVLTIDNGASQDTGSNPGFVKFLEPYMANSSVERSTGTISLMVSRFYSSELDANDIDNLAEIIKVENTAGRRDARNIAGNANPYELDGTDPIGIYAVANKGKEKDTSATEVITLSPPTGLSPKESRTLQLVVVILISVTLVAVAIVIIKKKVLIKK